MEEKNKKINNSAPLKKELPPGFLKYTGNKRKNDVEITLINYNPDTYEEKVIHNIEKSLKFRESSTITWLNINGLHNLDIIKAIGEHFEIHPLILEDILNVNQRPKVDEFDNYIFVVLKMLNYNHSLKKIETEQVSIIFGENFVLTFQERKGDVFDAVRRRIKDNNGRIRKMKADYLVYSLIDAIVDNYFIVLENIGERIEALEDRLILQNPTDKTLRLIHNLKRELLIVQKSVWPLREVVGYFQRAESNLITDIPSIYFRDIYDHIIQIIDSVETFRDMVTGLLDLYLSSLSNRINAVMKILTILATIFMPLTLITGIYGMNFKYMPEIGWKWGYPAVMFLMLVIALVMIVYFKKKKWW